ncbi:hypothetical protein BDV98DRAFT_42202 [Pterulicium gracile]|uniref:Integral membrane protein n=1 Tax=Pterulicium gracile TaxID=1884261 RepID=A0A5C3R111_9AGAR|nr:hypothetical protein BDV98DRAFT_42202 [Pterula gracilis]
MWPTFQREASFRPVVFTKSELIVICMMWGFTLGFGYFVAYNAFLLTMRVGRLSTFIILVWLEIIACVGIYGIPAILMTCGVIGQDNLWIWLGMVTGWILQMQCIIQIIVNRICILVDNPTTRTWWKLGMFLWIGFINVTVAIVWIPATLQISSRWMKANTIYDPIEKALYLLTDAGLNYYFIRTAQERLLLSGLTKYNRLLRYNKMIVWVSVSMDVLIIGSLFLKNPLVYIMMHPLAFMVKLEIEMTMSNLIVLLATGSGLQVDGFETENNAVNCTFASQSHIQSVQVRVHQEAVSHFDGDEISLHHDAKGGQHAIPMERLAATPFGQRGDATVLRKWPTMTSAESE